MSAPTVHPGPASRYAARGERILEFSDGASGGLLSLRRDAAGRLVVEVYRADPDVIVRGPRED